MPFWEYETESAYRARRSRRFQREATDKVGLGQTSSFLDATLGLLDRPRAAVGGFLSGLEPGGISPIEGAKRGITGEERFSGQQLLEQYGADLPNKPILGVPEGLPLVSGALTPRIAAGFGLDIAMDPLTYVPFGAATRALKATKAGQATGQAARTAITETPVLKQVTQAVTRTFSRPGFAGAVSPELGGELEEAFTRVGSANRVGALDVNTLTQELGERRLQQLGGVLPENISVTDLGQERLQRAVSLIERPTSTLESLSTVGGKKLVTVSLTDPAGNIKSLSDFTVGDFVRPGGMLRADRLAKSFNMQTSVLKTLDVPTATATLVNLGSKDTKYTREFARRVQQVSRELLGFKNFTPDELALRTKVQDVLNEASQRLGTNYHNFENYFPHAVSTVTPTKIDPSKARKYATLGDLIEAGYQVKPAHEALEQWMSVSTKRSARNRLLEFIEGKAVTLNQVTSTLTLGQQPLFIRGNKAQVDIGRYTPFTSIVPEQEALSTLQTLPIGLTPDIVSRGKRAEQLFVHNDIVEDVKGFYKAQTDGPSPFLAAFDALQGAWKASVLMFPAKVVRDYVTNIWTGFVLPGAMPHEIAKSLRLGLQFVRGEANDPGLTALLLKTGTTYGDLAREFTALNVMRGGQIGREIYDAFVHAPNWVSKAGAGASAFKHAYELLAKGEDTFRVAHALWRLEKGDTVEQAAKSTIKYLFDYERSSPMEKALFSRVAPFYRWTRNNLPLQAELLVTSPKHFALLEKLRSNANPEAELTPAELGLLVESMDNRFGVMLGLDAKGNMKVLAGTGLPVEDLNLLFSRNWRNTSLNALSQVSPFLRTPFELAFDFSSFSGKHISDPSYQNYYRSAYSIIKDLPGLRDWLEFEQHEYTKDDGSTSSFYTVDPQKMFVFQTIAARIYTTAGKLFDDRKTPLERGINFLTGARIQSVDLYRSGVYWNEPMEAERQTANSALEKLGQAFVDGEITGNDWRKARAQLLTHKSVAIKTIRESFDREEFLNNEQKRNISRRFFDDTQSKLDEYYSLSPEMFAGASGVPDMNAFYEARQALLDGIDDPVLRAKVEKQRMAYIEKLPPTAREVEIHYQRALDLYRLYRDNAPAYIGLPDELATEMEEAVKMRSEYRRTFGPDVGDMRMANADPRAYAVASIASQFRNPVRADIWRQINNSGGGLLSRFFSDLNPAEIDLEFGEIAA